MKYQFTHIVHKHPGWFKDEISELNDYLEDGAKVIRCDSTDECLIYILEADDGIPAKKEKIQIELTIKEKSETKKKVIEKVIETVNNYHLLER